MVIEVEHHGSDGHSATVESWIACRRCDLCIARGVAGYRRRRGPRVPRAVSNSGSGVTPPRGRRVLAGFRRQQQARFAATHAPDHGFLQPGLQIGWSHGHGSNGSGTCAGGGTSAGGGTITGRVQPGLQIARVHGHGSNGGGPCNAAGAAASAPTWAGSAAAISSSEVARRTSPISLSAPSGGAGLRQPENASAIAPRIMTDRSLRITVPPVRMLLCDAYRDVARVLPSIARDATPPQYA
jgi:hypothetical protein